MIDRSLSEYERKQLYLSLLRGMANIAQDQLCAEDLHHAWGPWFRYVVRPDYEEPIVPRTHGPMTEDKTYKVAARRTCLNCGKEQIDQ